VYAPSAAAAAGVDARGHEPAAAAALHQAAQAVAPASLAYCRCWPQQQEAVVHSKHFLQIGMLQGLLLLLCWLQPLLLLFVCCLRSAAAAAIVAAAAASGPC
jgi:hypothetical protein